MFINTFFIQGTNMFYISKEIINFETVTHIPVIRQIESQKINLSIIHRPRTINLPKHKSLQTLHMTLLPNKRLQSL